MEPVSLLFMNMIKAITFSRTFSLGHAATKAQFINFMLQCEFINFMLQYVFS